MQAFPSYRGDGTFTVLVRVSGVEGMSSESIEAWLTSWRQRNAQWRVIRCDATANADRFHWKDWLVKMSSDLRAVYPGARVDSFESIS